MHAEATCQLHWSNAASFPPIIRRNFSSRSMIDLLPKNSPSPAGARSPLKSRFAYYQLGLCPGYRFIFIRHACGMFRVLHYSR